MLQSKLNIALSSAILSVLVSSCMTSTNLSVLEPADIYIPQHIQKITVANRSIASKDNQVMNVVEGLFSGEGIGQDKRSSADAVLGVISGLNNSPRFKASQAANPNLKGTGTSEFPAPISWTEVEKLCKENYADALLLLEVFDSDTRKSFSTRQVSRTVNGQKVEVTEHLANAKMIVSTGWRIYDPVNRTVVDQFKAEDFKDFSGVGDNQEIAISKLPPKERALKETGYYAGEQYAVRIAPSWIWVGRSYYTKGSPEFKSAKMLARGNQWKDAAVIWKKLAETSHDPKIRKRAAYNMALACEVEGQLDLAVEWAKKAIGMGEKKAVNYINILQDRIADEQRAKEQMGEE